MTDVIRASLHSYKSLATRKQLQITLEVPEEYAPAALQMLGVPDPSGVAWFGIARLQIGPDALVKAGALAQAPNDGTQRQDKDRRKFEDMPRSQQAALMCARPDFTEWLGAGEDGQSDPLLKRLIGIQSKTELDTNTDKAAIWDGMLRDFQQHETTKRYAGMQR